MADSLTQADLLERLAYDTASVAFTWRRLPSHPKREGQVAGTSDLRGYRLITVNRKSYKAHRLAWLYVHGHWPLGEIDHKNGIKSDNRLDNLRDVPRRINAQNRIQSDADARVEVLGVSRMAGGRFRAVITTNKKQKFLGAFDSAQAAHAAYLAAKRELHAGCTL